MDIEYSDIKSDVIKSFDCTILSKKRITKALIRQCGCAGWSVPVLFANPRRQIFLASSPNIMASGSDATLFNSHQSANSELLIFIT